MIHPGTQELLIREATIAPGTTSEEGVIQTDALLATLFVNSVTSGTLTVSVYALTDVGKELLLFTFPTIVAPSTELVMKKSGVTLARFVVRATYTGICDYEIYIRAINNTGESSTRILGSNNWRVDQQDVTPVAAALISVALTDRNGVLVKNWSSTSTVYLAETLVKATVADGYPLAPKDALSMDIAAGNEVYAVTDVGTADVRIAESGT